MGLLLHALTFPTRDAGRGLRGLPLVGVHISGMTAWATALEEPTSFSREDLLDAHRVVAAIFERVDTCLPAQFPTLFPDEAALRAHLVPNAETLVRRLEVLTDTCELAITATWLAPEPPHAADPDLSPGQRYLRQRQRALQGSDRRQARAGELADAIERSLGADLLDARRRVAPSPAIALSLAVLVPRAAAARALASVPRSEGDVRILVNGPWPPYTFAGVGNE